MEKIEKILDNLNDRGGFDGWWDGIDEDIQTEIKEELNDIIDDTVWYSVDDVLPGDCEMVFYHRSSVDGTGMAVYIKDVNLWEDYSSNDNIQGITHWTKFKFPNKPK